MDAILNGTADRCYNTRGIVKQCNWQRMKQIRQVFLFLPLQIQQAWHCLIREKWKRGWWREEDVFISEDFCPDVLAYLVTVIEPSFLVLKQWSSIGFTTLNQLMQRLLSFYHIHLLHNHLCLTVWCGRSFGLWLRHLVAGFLQEICKRILLITFHCLIDEKED